MRRCSKTGCQSPALATLTYNYAASQVVIGPLSRLAEPHTYDLCGEHARRTTAPRGWEVLRLELPDRYEAVDADGAVRTVPTRPMPTPTATSPAGPSSPGVPPARPGLRVVRDGD